MRTNADPERDDALLDAMLRDDNWQTASAAFKTELLGTFRARQRVRRLTRSAAGAVALAAVIAGMVHWFGPPEPAPRQSTVAHTTVPKALEKPRYLTDGELVAKFPKGSCFIAEVDGQKQLVFFDPAVGRSYIAQSGVRGN